MHKVFKTNRYERSQKSTTVAAYGDGAAKVPVTLWRYGAVAVAAKLVALIKGPMCRIYWHLSA